MILGNLEQASDWADGGYCGDKSGRADPFDSFAVASPSSDELVVEDEAIGVSSGKPNRYFPAVLRSSRGSELLHCYLGYQRFILGTTSLLLELYN
jgi:hypothetical protein